MCFFNSLLNVSLLPCKAFSDFGKLLQTIEPRYVTEFLVSSFFGLIRSKFCLYSDCLFLHLLKSFINLSSVRLLYTSNMNMLSLLL